MGGLVLNISGWVWTLLLLTEPVGAFTSPLPQLLPQHENPLYALTEQGEVLLDLVGYLRAYRSPGASPGDESIPPYERRRHFGGWIRPERGNCLSTRARVLIRDAVDPTRVEMGGSSQCIVAAGQWVDPYTEKTLTVPRTIQVDHVVPLKNAYLTGAHGWAPSKRCHYGNFVGYRRHLIPIDGPENSRKGDRGPDRYMPPSRDFTCEYVKIWITIKTIWDLDVTRAEWNSVHESMRNAQCPRDNLKVPLTDLQTWKDEADHPSEPCLRRDQRPTELSELPIEDYYSEA